MIIESADTDDDDDDDDDDDEDDEDDENDRGVEAAKGRKLAPENELLELRNLLELGELARFKLLVGVSGGRGQGLLGER